MSFTAAAECCDSRPAGASCFISTEAGDHAAPKPPAAKTRILFVDDEPSMVRGADALQHSQGLHPELVPNPVDTEYLKLTGLDTHYESWRVNLKKQRD